MSLLEWIGESHNPGSMGAIGVGRPEGPQRSRGLVIFSFLLSAAGVGAAYYFLFTRLENPDAPMVLSVLAGTMVYLGVGYLLRPKPDMSNLGWAGGLFNNPFRISDDVNRFLLFLKIVLLPGRFVAESCVDVVVLIRNAGR